jgi:uncharacterized OsmC-like protein/pimeloyl-ACP methyl ester carboxylesterase
MMASEQFDFVSGSGNTLSGRLELPLTRPVAFAIFAHCFTCSKNIRAATYISRGLRARGIAVLRFDFTGIGNSEGDFANTNFSSNVDDIVAAAEALCDTFDAPQLLIGHSLGGAAVLMAAGQIPEVRAVATINAPSEASHLLQHLNADLSTIESRGSAEVTLGGQTFTISRQFVEDLRAHRVREALSAMDKALLIYHATGDRIVDLRNASEIYESANHPKSFIAVPTADHLLTDTADTDYIADTLAAWASRYLDARAAAQNADSEGYVVVQSTRARYAQVVAAGNHHLIADEPAHVGGDDAGMSPYDLLLAALGTCTAMTLRMYADRKQWPLESVQVRLRHDRVHAEDCQGCENRTGRVDVIGRAITIEGDLDEQQRARLVEIAERCPVHKTLTATPVIQTREESEVGAR